MNAPPQMMKVLCGWFSTSVMTVFRYMVGGLQGQMWVQLESTFRECSHLIPFNSQSAWMKLQANLASGIGLAIKALARRHLVYFGMRTPVRDFERIGRDEDTSARLFIQDLQQICPGRVRVVYSVCDCD